MTGVLRERRRRQAFSLAIAAAVLAGIAFVTVSIDVRSAQPNVAQGPVLPGLTQQIARATRVTVTTADGAYRIEKAEQGWVMRDRGDYPVNAARLAQLTEGLSNLAFTRRMTSDPARYARLGVGDPREGGSGVMVQVEDAQGALLANLILGVEVGGLYVRKPNEAQVWAATGELPPLRDVAMWLDLAPLRVGADAIARVEIVPREGRPYILAREAPSSEDFAIVAPARMEPATIAGVTTAAQRITRLAPIDVQPTQSVQGGPTARLRVHTFDGVLVDGAIVVVDNKIWLKLTASAERPEAEAAAAQINAGSAAWAYSLSAQDVDGLVPPLNALLPAAPEALPPGLPPGMPSQAPTP